MFTFLIASESNEWNHKLMAMALELISAHVIRYYLFPSRSELLQSKSIPLDSLINSKSWVNFWVDVGPEARRDVVKISWV